MGQYIVLWERDSKICSAKVLSSYEEAKAELKELRGYAENHDFAETETITTKKKNGTVIEISHIREIKYTGSPAIIEKLRLIKAE